MQFLDALFGRMVPYSLLLCFFAFVCIWSIGFWHFYLLTVHVDAVESSKVGTTQFENPIESTKQYNKGKTNQRLNPMNKLPGPLVRSPDPI